MFLKLTKNEPIDAFLYKMSVHVTSDMAGWVEVKVTKLYKVGGWVKFGCYLQWRF